MSQIKRVPNILTSVRIVCSLCLLLTEPLSFWFYALFLLGGVSDILDGYIARKTKSSSPFGAAFDSVADVVFIGVLLILFIPVFPWPFWLLCWIGIITVLRLLSLAAGFVKYRALAFLHTRLNKLTGLLLFVFPFLHSLWGLNITALVLCTAATVSALEELAINITSEELRRDRKSIFQK